MNIVQVLFPALSILCTLALCQHYVGDFCTLQYTGKNGQCRLLENCQAAIDALQIHGVNPQTCGYEDKKPIVCCTERVSNTETNSGEGTIKVLEKRKQKCQEYGKIGTTALLEGSPSSHKCLLRQDSLWSSEARPKEFPHLATIGFSDLQNRKIWACSGSLISERYVLTAASCLDNYLFGDSKYVRLGDLRLYDDTDDAEPQEFDIVERIAHPDFKQGYTYNDIALLKLNKPVTFSAYIKPACFNTFQPLTVDEEIVTGWNMINGTIEKLTMTYTVSAQCNKAYINNTALNRGLIDESQICSRSETKCQSDFGGPLQIYNNREVDCTYSIVGVTSLPMGCSSDIVPGVYTKVSKYVKWIEDIVWP